MAYHPEKGLIDPYGGIDDLKKRQIRAVGDPKGRFEEDALRMFRAWAFAARLQGTIEENTLKAIHEKRRSFFHTGCRARRAADRNGSALTIHA